MPSIRSPGVIFSRDCPEYEIRSPGGHRLVVLVNHLKSKGYGTQADNNARRARQAQRVTDIYRRLLHDGVVYVAVLGDFNDTPGSVPLAPLLHDTDLRDISATTGSTTAAGPAPLAPAPPRTASTTSCCHLPCSRRQPAAASSATAPGEAPTAPYGPTTTPSPTPPTQPQTTPPSAQISTSRKVVPAGTVLAAPLLPDTALICQDAGCAGSRGLRAALARRPQPRNDALETLDCASRVCGHQSEPTPTGYSHWNTPKTRTDT